MNLQPVANQESIVLGGGCFWCLEACFEPLRGVLQVVSGYAGGEVNHPTYQQVCSGGTGHAEVVQITFDPSQISCRELLEIFFVVHDPTTLNRQGADVGTQYRSIILTNSPEQQQIAAQVIQAIENSGFWSRPIVTQSVPLTQFFPAETYHQGYFRSNSDQPYCQAVISPKVAKLRQKFVDKLRK